MRKFIKVTMLTTALAFAAVSAAFAQTPVEIVATSPSGAAGTPNVFWTAGASAGTGSFEVTGAGGNATGLVTGGNDSNDSIFIGSAGGGALTGTGFTDNGGIGTQDLSGGVFKLYDGSTLYLSGTFTAASFSNVGPTEPGEASFGFTDITYTGGTWLPAGYKVNGTTVFGQGSFGITSASDFTVDPVFGFSSYQAEDGYQFYSSKLPTTTPEPASFATFGIGALALLALVAVKRRNTVNSL